MQSRWTSSKYGIQLKNYAFSLTADLKVNVNEKYGHVRTFQLAKRNEILQNIWTCAQK